MSDPTWTQLFPATVPDLFQGLAVFDEARNVTFMYGEVEDQVWTWNGRDWTNYTPAHSPGARSGSSIAYDRVNEVVVLFGGNLVPPAPDILVNDTWLWNGVDWEEQSPAHSPSVRTTAGMAYHTGSSKVLLYGGGAIGVLYTDTWTWDGTDWTEESPATQPGYLAGPMAEYPEVGLWMFTYVDDVTPNTFWQWVEVSEGVFDWFNNPFFTVPTPTLGLSGASLRNFSMVGGNEFGFLAVLFGGRNMHSGEEQDATWVLSGDWQVLIPDYTGTSDSIPLPKEFAAFAKAPDGTLVLWGGDPNGETETWRLGEPIAPQPGLHFWIP